MKEQLKNPVSVMYKFVDGKHYFISNDEVTKGLNVSNTDMKKAFSSVGFELSKLINKNYNQSVKFVPAITFNSFKQWHTMILANTISDSTPSISGAFNWVYK